jgi:chromosome segregation ATPase
METQPPQHEEPDSQEEKSAKQTNLSVNERLESALDKINRSEENFSSLLSVEDINDHLVVVSEALSVANEKLDKLTSEEEPNQESIRETKELVNNLEERKRKLTTEIEQKREKEMVVKKFLNSAENLGSKMYQLHMMLTEREDAGINPLITTEPQYC